MTKKPYRRWARTAYERSRYVQVMPQITNTYGDGSGRNTVILAMASKKSEKATSLGRLQARDQTSSKCAFEKSG